MFDDSVGQDPAEQSGNPLIEELEEQTQKKSCYLEQLDTVKIKERHSKIVEFFGDKPKRSLWKEIQASLPECIKSHTPDQQSADEVDAENPNEDKINMKKLKTVIRRVHTSTNPIIWFMNAISAYEGIKTPPEEWKEMEVELDGIVTGDLTYAKLFDYTKKVITKKPETKKKVKTFWTKCSESWSPDGKSAGQKVLKYIDAVAHAKKIYLSPKRILFPMLSLVHLAIFAFTQAWPDSNLVTQLDFDTKSRTDWWRYMSYSLVHNDWQHVVTNSLLLLGLGYGLEVAHGSGWVALLYILGVVSSSIAYFCFTSGSLLGCSGGVFCLVAASLSTIILNWNQDKVVLVRVKKDEAPYAFAGRVRQITTVILVIAFALLEIVPATLRRLHHEDAGISVVAHCFGAGTGFLTGFLILRDELEGQWKKTWKFLCLAVYCLFLGIGIGVNLTGYRKAVCFFWCVTDEEGTANSSKEGFND